MAKVKIEWNKHGLEKLGREIAAKMTDPSMEYTCIECGETFHPEDGRIICPNCRIEYLLDEKGLSRPAR